MSIRLAIDTTAEACSVALDTGSEVLQRYAHAPRRHGELLLPWIDELLAEAGVSKPQIDTLCVTRGPGSFTSLRMGFSVALGIAHALDIPVHPVSSLQTLALQAMRNDASHVISALDARMGEVYIASYINQLEGYPEAMSEELLIRPQDYQAGDTTARWQGIGSGFAAEQGALEATLGAALIQADADSWPMARDALILADKVTPVAAEQAELVYLRNQVVQT